MSTDKERSERLLRALDEAAGDGSISLRDLFLLREARASIALDKDDQVQTLHHRDDPDGLQPPS